MLCACFRPKTRFEPTHETVPPLFISNDLDVNKQGPDASSPAVRTPGKAVADQTSTRDTYTAADKASPVKAAPSPRPVLDAETSIWEKLASHEIRNLSPTPEPTLKERTPEPAQASTLAADQTPDLTITGTSINLKTQPLPEEKSTPGYMRPIGKVPRSARSSGGCDGMTTPPRRPSSGGCRKSAAGTPPSSLLKPTAASVARAQATSKPKSEEGVWKV